MPGPVPEDHARGERSPSQKHGRGSGTEAARPTGRWTAHLLHLQSAAGNRAVTSMIQRHAEWAANDLPRQGGHVKAVQRVNPPVKPPKPPPVKPLEPLADIALRIARLALGPSQVAMGAPNGPVLTVVRDLRSNKIAVGLNTGAPVTPTDLVGGRITEQREKVRSGAITPKRTHDPGEHSEVNAWDRAVRARQLATKRPVTAADADTFEVHNVWLKQKGRYTAAPRCEHCAAILRGVKVTQNPPQRVDGTGVLT